MEVLQIIFIWLFGGFAIIFLILALISIFSFGSTIFWVSEKANQKTHFYLLLAATSSTLWVISYYPNSIVEGIFCFLPIAILVVGFSYFKSSIGRKLFKKFTDKTNIDYPFESKEK